MQSPGSRLLTSPGNAEKRHGKLKWFLRLLLGIAVIGALLYWQGDNVGKALKNTSPFTLLAAVFIYLCTQFLSAVRWRWLLNAAMRARNVHQAGEPGKQLGFGECYRLYLIGMFCNLWLPTAVGGDAVRAALAAKYSSSLALAASSIFVERLTGLAALLTIGVLGLMLHFGTAFNSNAQDGQTHAVTVAISAIIMLAAFVVFIWLLRKVASQISARPDTSKFSQKFLKAHRAFDVYFTPATRPALLGALALSFAFQSSQIVLNIFLAHAVGLDLPPGIFVWLIPCLGLASMLPVGIGGLGVREAGAVAFLSGALPAAAMPEPGTIIAWSLLWQATLWVSGLPGALAYFGTGFKTQSSTSTPPDTEV